MTALRLGTRARLGLSSRGRHGAPPPPFSPASITGLAFWYDAVMSPTVEAGGVIEQWQDLSGQANHASQAAHGQRPVREIDQAGREVVRFDGEDDALLVASPPDLSAGVTAFVVFRMREPMDAAGILSAGDGAGADDAAFFAFADAPAADREVRLTARSGEAGSLALTAVDSTLTQFALFTIDADSGTVRDLNGETSDTKTSGAFGVPAAIALGARLHGASTADPAAVDLYEVGLYSGILAPTDLDRLETYLRGRHGLIWTPLQLGADVAWFHDVQSSPLVLAGDDVVRWTDLGPDARDWHQSGLARPVRTTDVSDHAAVRFDGADDVLLMDGTPPALVPFTSAIVCAVRTPGDFAGILSAAPASGSDVSEFFAFQSIDGSPPALSLQGRALEADPMSLALDDPGTVQLAIWTTGSGTADLEIAGSSVDDTYDGTLGTPAEIVLGGRFDGAPFGYAAIDVYATLGVRRVLTTTERQRLIAWAESRWEL